MEHTEIIGFGVTYDSDEKLEKEQNQLLVSDAIINRKSN